MRHAAVLLLALLLAPLTRAAAPTPALPSPATEVVAAHRAILRVRPDDRRFVQFLTCYHMTDEERAEFVRVLNVHVNRISRKPNLRKPLLVTPTLVLVDRRWFGWARATVDLLANVDPHFHARVKNERGKVETVNAPLDKPGEVIVAKAFIGLTEETESRAPILRADWFLRQTIINKGRVAGYYKFLRLTKRADFDKLVGFNKATAQASFREVATIVQSGKDGKVAQRNRQVFRFGATDGGYWETRDQLEKETDEGNAINQLDGDYVFQAVEIFAPLPNDLFAYLLAANDANGTLQDTAPDEVGSDTTSTSLDGKIHVGLSCIRCHEEGLRPIKDYARRLWRGRRKLVTPDGDQKRQERLGQLYLKDYERKRKSDNERYRDALAAINGEKWTPATDSQALREAWRRWNDDRVDRAQAARELGLSEAKFAAALERYARPLDEGGAGQILPNALLGFIPAEEGDKPLKMTREQFDEHYGLAFLISRGIIPGLEPAKPAPKRKKR